MSSKFPAASKLAVLLACAVGTLAVAGPADAAPRRQVRTVYTNGSPNVVYQQGPRTRIYVSKRSWLDGGTEVNPGDRKFNDYAFPPVISFARENNNRPLDRQPLSPPVDLGGSEGSYPWRYPLY